MTKNQAFEILKNASNSRDARVILRDMFGDEKLSQNKDEQISFYEKIRIKRAAKKLKCGVPVAKIIKKKWFYGMIFETGMHTLDPRPDSEALVEAVLEMRNENPSQQEKAKLGIRNIKILDLGTGTGCLICALVKNLPGVTGIGIDRSFRACRVARRNVKNLELDGRIKIMRGDFKKPLKRDKRQETGDRKFDIIISNPPYIANGDPHVDAGAIHDPHMALFADENGLAAYRTIAKTGRELLNENGKIFLEIGMGQGRDVRKIFENAGWKFIGSKNDLSGIERVLIFSYKI